MPGSTLFKAFVLFVALWAPFTQAGSGWQPIQETIRKSEKRYLSVSGYSP